MNPQQKEFDTALSSLTPEQRATYMKANPAVGVGGVQQSVNAGMYQPIPKVITSADLNTSANLTPLPPKIPTTSYTPTITAPTGATLGTDGMATVPPSPPQPKVEQPKEKNAYQKVLESIGFDIGQLEKQPEITKQLQEQQQLAQKTEQATRDYNTYNLRKRELENKLREMETTNPEGQYGGARQAVIEDYRRKANSELADLAIQAQASQGLLESARQTIKDILEAQFKPIEDRISRRMQYAQLASNDLTESEKYTLDQLNKKDETNQKEVSTFATSLASTLLENNAPVGVRTNIFNIAGDYASGKITKEQALSKMSEAAGSYGQNIVDQAYKKAQTEKIIADTKKVLADTVYANDTTVVNSPLVNAITNVNAGSAEGQQKRDAQQVAQFVKNGQTKQAQQLILSRVTSKMSATEREAELDRRNTIDALTDMKSALNDYVSTTGDTNILTGNIENIANKIGQTSDPRLAAIKTRIVQATQKYRNAITGAAWGDQETAEYKTIFPSITNTSKLNNTIIDTMIPLLKNNERNAIGLFLGGSDVYDSIFSEGQNASINEGATKEWNGVTYKVINGVWTPQ